MAKLLEVKNLNVSFKIDAGRVLAVNGVSFSLDEGKVLGIVGESGSGKSVTAYSIMQILDKNGHVDTGSIKYKGTDLLKLSEKEMRDIRGNKISIIFQDAMTSLNPVWTIGNQLREAILIHAKDPIKEAVSSQYNDVKAAEQYLDKINKKIKENPTDDTLVTKKESAVKDLANKKEIYAKAKQAAISDLKAKEKVKKDEYNAKKPELNKNIKTAIKTYIKDFKKIDKNPNIENIDDVNEVKELKAAVESQKSVIENAKKEYGEFKNSFDVSESDENYSTKKYAYNQELTARSKAVIREEKVLVGLEKKYKKYINKYPSIVAKRPRRERYEAIKTAKKEKYVFYNECKSAFRETKYSANKKALAMLKEVGITEPEKRLSQYSFELSGGMLQRCMIAMALVQRPDILIADEPTTALDVTIQAQILDLLKKLQQEYGMAIVIITHDLGVIAQVCDEVDIMYAGRIVERGTVDDIFYNPQHEYTKGLIKSMPSLDSKKGKLESIAGNPVDLFCLPKGCAFSARCSKCMQICIDKYPEEVLCDESGHQASCWAMVKRLHEEGIIDVVEGEPTGKPLEYNGAIIRNKEKGGKK